MAMAGFGFSHALHANQSAWRNTCSGTLSHSTGLHSILTRSPGWFVVWQDILAGSSEAAPAVASAPGAGSAGIGFLFAVANPGAASCRCFWETRRIGMGFAGVSAGAASGTTSTGSAGGVLAMTRGGACSGVGFQGVQLLRRVKASTVGLVKLSAVGIDCMQPANAIPVRHRAARFEIDSMIALSCC
ncbi:hypothetical protein ACXIUS_16835 [Bosea thiooxidans]|nr:hypothetical protein [Bosea sp. (in: a-proteobacteria)]